MRYRGLCMGVAVAIGVLAPTGASAEGWGSLGLSYHEVLPGGGVASQGVGLSATRAGGPGQGTIALAGIPEGAIVHEAFLYWATYGGSDQVIRFAGQPIEGQQIGRDGDTCWYGGDASNATFRASVSSLVSGNGSYPVAEVGGGQVDGQGASLVVVYLQPNEPTVTDVRIVDGLVSTNNQIFRELRATVPLGLTHAPLFTRLHAGFGDGNPHVQNGEDTSGGEGPLKLNGIEVLAANSISGTDGPYWDDVTLNVPPGVVQAGQPSASATINNGLDCFSWSYLALEVGQPDTIGPFVRGIPDRPASPAGWHDGPVTIRWEAYDGNGATQPPDSVIQGEGRDLSVTSAPSCDRLGNCSTGTARVNIDATPPETDVRPMEFPIVGELPDEFPLRIFDSWVGGSLDDGLSGISGVSIEVTEVPAGDTEQIAVEWINCDPNGTHCEFGAQLPERPVQRVVVAAIDRAGNLDASPVELLAIQPPIGFEECPLGPLC